MGAAQPRLLALIVGQDERTHEEIIAGFNDCARDNGEDATLSPRTFRRWLSGDVRTQPRPTQRRVARLYWGLPMSQLLAPAPPETATSPPAADAPAKAASPLDRTTQDPQDPSLGVERRIVMATRRAARFTSLAEAHNLGPETLNNLRDHVSELACCYVRDPLVTLISEVVETQDAIFTLLEGRQKPAHTRDLYLLAGVVSGLLAKASHDLQRPHEAMTQARTVYVCADNADHPGLRAFARALQSLIAYWADRPHEAVRYAQSGAELSERVTGSITAWLPALEARAWAQLGDGAQTRGALARAADARERVSADDLDAIGGLLTFPAAKQHYYTAGSYVFLAGDESRAQDEATAALRLFEQEDTEQRSFSDEAGARAELALARLGQGELAGACEAVSPILSLPPERRIGGIVTSVARVHHALRSEPHADSRLARATREEIEAFSQIPAAAALPR